MTSARLPGGAWARLRPAAASAGAGNLDSVAAIAEIAWLGNDLSPLAGAPRHIAERWRVIDHHRQGRAKGEPFEGEAGAHKGEGADLATQVELLFGCPRRGADLGLGGCGRGSRRAGRSLGANDSFGRRRVRGFTR